MAYSNSSQKGSSGLYRTVRWIAAHPLNATRRVAALTRFARWQVASRLIKSPIALPFVGETRLLVEAGMTGATGNWYGGLHEPSEMAFVLHALRAEDLFADVGANIGSYTVLAAGAVGADVIAVEPLPSTFERLQRNIRLNGINNRVQAHCCGLSNEAGRLLFTSDLDTTNSVATVERPGSTEWIPVNTLDALCSQRTPSVIKIDVEGYESAVLDGAKKTLSSNRVDAVLLETNGSGVRFGVTDDQLISTMLGFGFTACEYQFKERLLKPARRGGTNTIFVRDVAATAAKCRSAPNYRLVNGTV